MMKHILFTILFSIFATQSPSSAHAVELPAHSPCESLLRVATPEGQTEYVSDNVSVVWYPKAGYVLISHVELALDGKLYDNNMGLREKRAVDKAEERAREGDRGFFKFSLRVTPEELENLRNYVAENEGKARFQSCVSGACKVLRENTAILLPPGFSHVPTLNAIYFTVMHKLGYKRIAKVEYVGRDAYRNLVALEPVYELYQTYKAGSAIVGAGVAVGYFILHLINDDQKTEKVIVPVQVAN